MIPRLLRIVIFFVAMVAFCRHSAVGMQEGVPVPPFRVSPAAWPGQITVEHQDAGSGPLVVATIGSFSFRVVLERALPTGATLVIDPGKVWFSNPDPLINSEEIGPGNLA